MGVPDEFALQLDESDILVIQLGHGARDPVLGEAGQRAVEIHLGAHSRKHCRGARSGSTRPTGERQGRRGEPSGCALTVPRWPDEKKNLDEARHLT